MLPSPVDRQALIKMLRTIDKGLDAVSPSILPWIEAYFNGTEFPEAGEELREVQLQLGQLMAHPVGSLFFQRLLERGDDALRDSIVGAGRGADT